MNMMNLAPMQRDSWSSIGSGYATPSTNTGGGAVGSIINQGTGATTIAPGHTTANLPSSVPGQGTTTAASNITGSPSSTQGPQYTPPSNFDPRGFDPEEVASGSPGYDNQMWAANSLVSPTASNYVIGGMNNYQSNMNNVASGYNALSGFAQNQGSALQSAANSQNTAYQGNVNSSTQDFLNNASGLGNYNQTQASTGSDQQNAAYNAITNMAQGNGPSLAGKNLQAGLNQQNQAVQAASMSNQGLGGAGNAQRNALNAQTANTNNELQAAQQASTAEQLGALSQQSTAANNIRSSNQAQASAASSVGLTQRGQNQSQLSTQYGAQLAGNTLQNGTNQAAASYMTGAQSTGLAGAAGAYNNQFNANAQQTNNNMGFDTASQQAGVDEYNARLGAVQSQAAQEHGAMTTVGNITGGVATAYNNNNGEDEVEGEDKTGSDQDMKTDTDQGSDVNEGLASILKLGDSSKSGTSSANSAGNSTNNNSGSYLQDLKDIASIVGFFI